MEKDDIKQYIAQKVEEGLSLSKIQDELTAQGVKITFMELRLIASEIESGVFKRQEVKEEKKEEKQAPPPPQDEIPEDDMQGRGPLAPEHHEEDTAAADDSLRGQTTVTVSPIQRPGFVASGTVSFGSGAKGDWFLDQTGRLGFDNMEGKPDQKDIMEFQLELRKAFGA